MRALGPFLRDAWRLARPYFKSEERWSAWTLLISIIVLNLMMVGMNVVLNFWNGAFYDTLQNKDWTAFIQLLFLYRRMPSGNIMPGFCLVAAVYIVVAVYATYLNQWLQIRWRRWMTTRFLDEWLADRAYYRISLTHQQAGKGTDNPDQRISDDLRNFCSQTLSLGLDLMSNVVTLFSFVGILWSLSGPITLFGVTIGGYMVWAALIYAILGTWFTHLVGRPLAMLSFQQQQVEADFRFSLVRLRENMEGVALYGGESEEHDRLDTRFRAVIRNWWSIMNRTKLLNTLTNGYNQVAVVFPIVVAAPRYFAGQIQLGGLTRTAGAFGQVQSAMSWFVNAYISLAAWRATVERLATFHGAIVAARAAAGEGPQLAQGAGAALAARGLTLTLPDGRQLLSQENLDFPPGQATVISGRSGSGKSTLFRALAGIWPFGEGQIARPAGTYLFLPQRPYIPLGTLRHAAVYPLDSAPEDAVAAAMKDVGLGGMVEELDADLPWAQRLSGGEQQRLAIARALIAKPDWLFLDEATASLDPEAEEQLYHLLRERLPDTTIISIAHRPSVAAFHDRRLVFRRPAEGAGLIEDAGPALLAAPGDD